MGVAEVIGANVRPVFRGQHVRADEKEAPVTGADKDADSRRWQFVTGTGSRVGFPNMALWGSSPPCRLVMQRFRTSVVLCQTRNRQNQRAAHVVDVVYSPELAGRAAQESVSQRNCRLLWLDAFRSLAGAPRLTYDPHRIM